LKAEIETVLQRFFRQPPAVTVAVSGLRHPGVVYVLVEGERSSAVPYRKGLGALEALALAGGAGIAADLKHASVLHPDGKRMQTDLSLTAQQGGPEANSALQAGDLLIVPRLRPHQVVVVGGVVKQGPI